MAIERKFRPWTCFGPLRSIEDGGGTFIKLPLVFRGFKIIAILRATRFDMNINSTGIKTISVSVVKTLWCTGDKKGPWITSTIGGVKSWPSFPFNKLFNFVDICFICEWKIVFLLDGKIRDTSLWTLFFPPNNFFAIFSRIWGLFFSRFFASASDIFSKCDLEALRSCSCCSQSIAVLRSFYILILGFMINKKFQTVTHSYLTQIGKSER